MKNVVCAIAPTPIVAAHDSKQGTTRSVYLTNNSAEAIWLQFDAMAQNELSPVIPCGYKLAAGANLVLASGAPGAADGRNAVYGCSVSGLAICTVQLTQGTKTLP